MTLKELKSFIARLPEEMEDFSVVNGEVGYLEEGNEDSAIYRLDKPIIALYVDEKEKEICFFHQTKEDVKTMMQNGDSKES
jgi:hypothetical protein